MAKLLSGKVPSLHVGLSSFSESKQSLTVVGLSTFTGNIKARSDLYVDAIRRYTDNSTNTKITLESGRVKLFAGNGTTPKININGGVGINTSLNVTGLATFQSNVHLGDNVYLKIGDSDDFQIHHDGSNTTIQNQTGFLKQTATNGAHYLQSNLAVELTAHNDAEKLAKFIKDGPVELYYDNSKKFQTSGIGVTVTRQLDTTDLNVSGIATFASTVNVLGDLNVTGDITYDEISGRNLNITGLSTFASTVEFAAGSAISIGGTTGEDGQYLQSTGTGVTWASGSVLRNTSSTVATAGTDTFTLNYTAGFLDVYVNGVKLAPTEFTATNGTSVVLGEAAFGGETVDFHAFNTPSTGVSPNVLHDPPATSSSTGLAGQMSYDSDYLYVCVATNTWKRATLSTF